MQTFTCKRRSKEFTLVPCTCCSKNVQAKVYTCSLYMCECTLATGCIKKKVKKCYHCHERIPTEAETRVRRVAPPEPRQRKTKLNPRITVLMETCGMHPATICRAITSFCRQTYRNAKLLIINMHPTPFDLSNVPDGIDIEVLNIEDTFVRPVFMHANSIGLCKTDCWTILDDDDWYERDHLEQLVTYWNTCVDRSTGPLQVCSRKYISHYEGYEKEISFQGWGVSLFEKLSPDELEWCFKLFPRDMVKGADTWIAQNQYYSTRLFDGRPTYHWDRTGARHLSWHEIRRDNGASTNFWYHMNYWRNKIFAFSTELEPVILLEPE